MKIDFQQRSTEKETGPTVYIRVFIHAVRPIIASSLMLFISSGVCAYMHTLRTHTTRTQKLLKHRDSCLIAC